MKCSLFHYSSSKTSLINCKKNTVILTPLLLFQNNKDTGSNNYLFNSAKVWIKKAIVVKETHPDRFVYSGTVPRSYLTQGIKRICGFRKKFLLSKNLSLNKCF